MLMKSKKRKIKRKGNKKTNINIIKDDAIVINKNGSRIYTDEFNQKISNITHRALRYSFNSRILGNYIIQNEKEKNV